MSTATTSDPRSQPLAKGRYAFPPGLDHNLLFYAVRKFRPADPIALFTHLAQKYGDIAHYRLGPEHIVFVNSPEYVREILVVQNDNFIKERTQQRTKVLLGNGLITSDGAAHRAQRRAAQPAFHRQRITAYADTMTQHTARLLDTWRDGETRELSTDMMQLTLGIVAATLFSTELGQDVVELNAAVNEIMRDYHFLIALPLAELLINFPIPQLRRFRKARSKLDAFVYRLIEGHRSGSGGSSSDLLSMLIEARGDHTPGDEQLRDEVLTILLAGFETVANALTWTFYLLSLNPEAERRLHQEIDGLLQGRAPALDDVPRLRYTEMVMAESMRLYPPAWAMGRRALNDFSLGPWRFPARTTVLMSQFVMHRDARYWNDPLRFLPERFEDASFVAALAGRPSQSYGRVPRFCYYPFGAGPRQCIGESFAWMEGILTIAAIAQRWRLRLVPGHPVDTLPLITLRPKYGMKMQVEVRP